MCIKLIIIVTDIYFQKNALHQTNQCSKQNLDRVRLKLAASTEQTPPVMHSSTFMGIHTQKVTIGKDTIGKIKVQTVNSFVIWLSCVEKFIILPLKKTRKNNIYISCVHTSNATILAIMYFIIQILSKKPILSDKVSNMPVPNNVYHT